APPAARDLRQRAHHPHARGGPRRPLWEEQETPEYDMDSEDERWLKQQRLPELTELKFEQMMDKLEKSSGQTVVTLNEAKLLLERQDDLIIAVKNDESSYEKMLKLRRELASALSLLEMVSRREKVKREMVRLTALLAERRYAAGDFTTTLPEPARTPLSAVAISSNSFRREYNTVQQHFTLRPPSTTLDQPRQREKRPYKRRKHRHHTPSSVQETRECTSSEEECVSPVEDGPFAFRRKPGCFYEMEDLESQRLRTPKVISRDYHTSGKHPWRHAFRQHLSKDPHLWIDGDKDTPDSAEFNLDIGNVKLNSSDVKMDISDIKMEISDVKMDISDVKMEISDIKIGTSEVKLNDIKVEPIDIDMGECTVNSENCVEEVESNAYSEVNSERTIDNVVWGNLRQAVRKRALSSSSDCDSDESLLPVEREFQSFVKEVQEKWLHFRPKTPPPTSPNESRPEDLFQISLDTPLSVEIIQEPPSGSLDTFTTSEFTLGDLYGDINPEADNGSLENSNEDLFSENFTGLTEAQVESILSETDLKALDEDLSKDDKKVTDDLLEELVKDVDGKSFLLQGQSLDWRAGSGPKRKRDVFGSSNVQVKGLAKEPIYIETVPPKDIRFTSSGVASVASVVTAVSAGKAAGRRLAAPLVQLAPAGLHKPLQLHHPSVVVNPVHHVTPSKLKVLHAHPLTHTQRAQLLAQNRQLAQIPAAVVSLATIGDAKPPAALLKAAPGSVAQFFEIKSGQLSKGPHLVNVLRQPQPQVKSGVARVDFNDAKKRHVVFDGTLKGNMAAATRPHRISLDGRQIVRATLPVRPPIRHQIQLKNHRLQVATPIRATSEPSTSIAIAPTKTASIPSAVVANLLQKNVLPKGQKIAISGPGGQALSANVQAIAFTTAQLKARQGRLIAQPRPTPVSEMVEASTAPVATSSNAANITADTSMTTESGDAPTNGTVRRRPTDNLPMEVTVVKSVSVHHQCDQIVCQDGQSDPIVLWQRGESFCKPIEKCLSRATNSVKSMFNGNTSSSVLTGDTRTKPVVDNSIGKYSLYKIVCLDGKVLVCKNLMDLGLVNSRNNTCTVNQHNVNNEAKTSYYDKNTNQNNLNSKIIKKCSKARPKMSCKDGIMKSCKKFKNIGGDSKNGEKKIQVAANHNLNINVKADDNTDKTANMPALDTNMITNNMVMDKPIPTNVASTNTNLDNINVTFTVKDAEIDPTVDKTNTINSSTCYLDEHKNIQYYVTSVCLTCTVESVCADYLSE
ncbi:unnamed protein product, partial [Leptidea sinapis]